MSSDYPVLDDRPINKWKVVELKEELKRRNLATKGLKDELVRRLSEAIREEAEAVEDEESKSSEEVEAVEDEESKSPDRETEPASGLDDAQQEPNPVKLINEVQEHHQSEVIKVIEPDTNAASGLEDAQPDPNLVNLADDVEEHDQSEAIKSIEPDTNAASGLKDAQPDPNPVNLADDVEEHDQSEAIKSIEPDTNAACGLEDAQPDPNPVNLADDVEEHHQSEAIKGIEPDTNAASDLEEAQPDPDSAKSVDDVEKHHQSEVNHVDADVARAGHKNCLVDTDVEKHHQSEVNNINADVANRGVEIEENKALDEVTAEGTELNSSQDKDVVEVSGVPEVSIQGNSTIQDIGDTIILPSERVFDNDVDVTPVASKEALENDSIKMDVESDVSEPTTQVYEVNPNLGSQVKSDSFSTDTSLPINEKNKDLNDNLNADNVKLETEVVRHDMELRSSPSKDLPVVGSSHPLDDQMPHEIPQGLVGETDDHVKFSVKNDNADKVSVDVTNVEHGSESKASNNSEQTDEKARTLGDIVEPSLLPDKIKASAEENLGIAASGDDRKDFSKITDVVDGENMEKINLDQSDDSMEEDVVETKLVDFDHVSKTENDKTEEPGVPASGSSDGMQQDITSEKFESPFKDRSRNLSDKRKFQDEVRDVGKEPAKRQRRWNTENLKTAEPQTSSFASSKNLVHTAPVKPILGRTNSTVGGDAPKERFVPKSSETATNSLKIENFVRPFTLKAVQELLARTGEVQGFWMDQIKTHCYVTYSSVEEAVQTRNAVYNLQWPPNGGRFLVADFVDPEKAKAKIEGLEPTAPAVAPAPPSVQAPPELPLSRQPPAAPPTKERQPTPVADKDEAPIVTLDDLFRKTKATPRIYYLPLTDEQVAKKLANRGNASKR